MNYIVDMRDAGCFGGEDGGELLLEVHDLFGGVSDVAGRRIHTTAREPNAGTLSTAF